MKLTKTKTDTSRKVSAKKEQQISFSTRLFSMPRSGICDLNSDARLTSTIDKIEIGEPMCGKANITFLVIENNIL